MDFALNLEYKPTVATVIIFLLLIIALLQILYIRILTKRMYKLNFQKRSQSSKYGKMTEQFLPFLEVFPWDPTNFRFLGSPVDGIQFEDDKVLFLEFKSSSSVLSSKQKNIKKLVDENKVFFEEIRIDL
ncbi:MAG: endonuclease [Dehalococcoidaceae bacterium]|mgnify:FL=1|nr:endonuclease [Dehalococcoidaceae bacterium]|tara:strand:- start:3296 stop:3682 length:387 start_codon:yes stop_codon:yes gene_type:complete